LESGKIVIESGDEHVTLVPDEHVDIKIEAKAKKDKQKFSFEVSWFDNGKADLKISDKEPQKGVSPVEKKTEEAPREPVKKATPVKKSATAKKTAPAQKTKPVAKATKAKQ
jgi:hypothetical protein